MGKYGPVILLILLALLLSIATICWNFLRPPPDPITLEPVRDSRVGFILLGDQGTRNIRQWLVARDVRKVVDEDKSISALFLLGDSFYPNGVKSSKDLRWRYAFENMYRGGRLNSLPFYAVLGNHDVQGDVEAYLQYAERKLGSGRWQMPARNYWRDFGRSPMCTGCPLVRVALLDTTGDIASLRRLPAYLEGVFREAKARWRVVVAHHPIRNFGRYRYHTEVSDALSSTLQRLRIHLYASGHDHNQQLIWSPSEPVFLINGNSGKQGYPIACCTAQLLHSHEGNGFSQLHFSPDQMEISLHDGSDMPDRFSWIQGAESMPMFSNAIRLND